MSKINDKLGLRPAGKRAMMKLPRDGALRAAITSAICPSCGQRGARLVGDKLHCSWCAASWPFPGVAS